MATRFCFSCIKIYHQSIRNPLYDSLVFYKFKRAGFTLPAYFYKVNAFV